MREHLCPVWYKRQAISKMFYVLQVVKVKIFFRVIPCFVFFVGKLNKTSLMKRIWQNYARRQQYTYKLHAKIA